MVDLLVARRQVLGAHLDGGSGILELEVVGLGAVLEDARLILGIAGVCGTLDTRVLVGVVVPAKAVNDWSTSPLSASCSDSWAIPPSSRWSRCVRAETADPPASTTSSSSRRSSLESSSLCKIMTPDGRLYTGNSSRYRPEQCSYVRAFGRLRPFLFMCRFSSGSYCLLIRER